ncbi:MAG: CidA/LrgA family protein [Cyanobacteria bacterium P01_F01_bin.53]
MDFLNGITLLLIYELVGEVISGVFHIPIPGPVLGMLFLFLTLLARGQSADSLDSAANVLLGHLSLLFVPAGVGIMVHFERLSREWLPISLTLVVTTAMTMAVTATIMQLSTRTLVRRVRHDG